MFPFGWIAALAGVAILAYGAGAALVSIGDWVGREPPKGLAFAYGVAREIISLTLFAGTFLNLYLTRAALRVAQRQTDISTKQTALSQQQADLSERQVTLAEQTRKDSIDPKIACFAEIAGASATMIVRPNRGTDYHLTSPKFCLRNYGKGHLENIKVRWALRRLATAPPLGTFCSPDQAAYLLSLPTDEQFGPLFDQIQAWTGAPFTGRTNAIFDAEENPLPIFPNWSPVEMQPPVSLTRALYFWALLGHPGGVSEPNHCFVVILEIAGTTPSQSALRQTFALPVGFPKIVVDERIEQHSFNNKQIDFTVAAKARTVDWQ